MVKGPKGHERKVQTFYFSPTGNTRRILSIIVDNVGLKAAPPKDLTLPSQRNSFTGKVEGDLILVGSPVYAGTIPLPFLESLQKISGEGKWAVPVAVYGNRSPDTAAEELTKILRGRGFRVLASASFIGQHSFATPEHPWGIGRPDEADMMTAAEFGKAVGEKFKHSPAEISVPGLLLERFSNTMVEDLPEGYHSKVLDRPRELWRISLDKAGCTQCNSCVDSCPVAAIDAESFGIDDGKCIRCMACVRACPTGTMRIVYSDAPSALERFTNLDKIFAIRKEPKTIL
ncbi:MAG: 4Fe-4S binding protein [Candidatus Bathyarchaeota archaeon]|nr:4Fe-4S binding protein [Candidatus Bathyarchaeota archaeon]